jgi:phosphoglycerate dehydrogenase-like enzyme
MNLKDCRILVTPTSYGSTNISLKTELERQVGEVIYNPTKKLLQAIDLLPLIENIDGYIAGLDVIDAQVIKSANRLKVISRYGVGVDNIDLAAAKEKGIVLTNTPGANSGSVAEMTVGLILSLARRIPEAVMLTRLGDWSRLNGISLEGKTVGLLGFGAIGREVARRLAGFKCYLIAYDPFPDLVSAKKLRVTLVPLKTLITESDFVSLHCPLLPETREIVNQNFLLQMKQGSFLINTARGELINENALVHAIQRGRLGGVALDVFSNEPPASDNPLLRLPQVLVTPHSSSHTDGATNTMGWMALNDCLAVLRGEAPKYPVK